MKIKNISLLAMVAVVVFVLSACMSIPQITMTPLEIQRMQTREYEATREVVFPSIISVFQDIGYTIGNADIQLGLIFAESYSASDFASKFFLGITNVTQTKVTAFIEKLGNKTKVRLNFVEVRETSYSQGQSDRQDTPLLDVKLYENAFEKIETAVFIRNSN